MYEWLPVVGHYFPGAVTPFNVRDLSVRWWIEYAGRAKTQFEAEKAAAKKASQKRR